MRLLLKYILNLLVSIDQLFNTLLGGDPDMTLSGRMGRAIKENRCLLCKFICKILNKFDGNHCAQQDLNEADEGKDEVIKL